MVCLKIQKLEYTFPRNKKIIKLCLTHFEKLSVCSDDNLLNDAEDHFNQQEYNPLSPRESQWKLRK